LERSLVIGCAENFCVSIPKRFLNLTDDDLRTVRKEEFSTILKNTTERLTTLAGKVCQASFLLFFCSSSLSLCSLSG
jgi:hypothetical protein